MSDTAIRVEKLSKRYEIGLSSRQHETIRERVSESFQSLFRFRNRGRDATISPAATGEASSTFWALKDISFDLKQGEVLGIIGRNGAGKSTLLKILSRITEPTEGRAELHGRVGSLLEVGAGFHSELTGRENVFLSGVILGMKRSEIQRKFDDIVEFAGVEKFIDTPVKRYSSGMYVRLAFAVAAHLEPEILIVDEVLAVGDASFQTRCLGKMGDVARQGRTVLFVSHNLGAISNLCSSAMWLDGGRLISRGDVESTIASYIKSTTTSGESDSNRWRHTGTGEARITNARLLDSTGMPCTSFGMGDTLIVELDVQFFRPFPSVNIALGIRRVDLGIEVLHLESEDCGLVLEDISPGTRRLRIEIPNCTLYPAMYRISPHIWNPSVIYDYVPDAMGFSMVQTNISKRSLPLSLHKQAIFYQPSKWSILDH